MHQLAKDCYGKQLSGSVGLKTSACCDASSVPGQLQVAKIFDWYGKDFEKGHKGYDSLKTTFARHAAQLAATPEAQARVRNGDYKLDFLDYDWRLNDIRK